MKTLPKIQSQSAAHQILELAKKSKPFLSDKNVPHTIIKVKDHEETWPIVSKEFNNWLRQKCYDVARSAPKENEISEAIRQFVAYTVYEKPHKQPVYQRVASHNGIMYLDLCNEKRQVVQIRGNGWDVLDKSPVHFVRNAFMKPLPLPSRTPSIDGFNALLNLQNKNDEVLLVTFMLAALNSEGPYPILVLLGPKGSSKSTTTKMIKDLVDSTAAPIRSFQNSEGDFMLSAVNGRVLAFDNVSKISPAESDWLCKLSTGAGFSTRTLYTNSEETVFETKNPVILNGISNFITRSDLADRTITVRLQMNQDTKRKTEAELWKQFESDKPNILSYLLDGLVEMLKNKDDKVEIGNHRMADFYVNSCRAETAFWDKGTFGKAYKENRQRSKLELLDQSQLAKAIHNYVQSDDFLRTGRTGWTGSPEEFSIMIEAYSDEPISSKKDIDAKLATIGIELKNIAPLLAENGIIFEKTKDNTKNRNRIYRITKRG